MVMIARACYLIAGELWSTVRMEQIAFGGILCLLRSDRSLRWLDGICTDASEKGIALAVREGCRELASEVGRVSEWTRFKNSSRSIRAKSRALRTIAPEAGLECFSSDENEVSLARRECRADILEASLQLLDSSEWKLAAYGGLFRKDTLQFSKHVPSCMLFDMQRVVVRRDTS